MNKKLEKIGCRFGVITGDVKVDIVTEKLGIEPTRFFNYGEEHSSQRFPNRKMYYSYGLWVIEKKTIGENLDMDEHIRYFKDLFSDKIDIIRSLKEDHKFECSFTIDVQSVNGNYGYELKSDDLEFIRQISTRFGSHIMETSEERIMKY